MTSPFSVEDLYLNHKVMELDGDDATGAFACTVRSVDRENDSYVSCIWEVPADGLPPRQLTHGPGKDNTPRWSPDGKQLAFVSNRSGGLQVHLLPRAGGEARQLTKFEQAASDMVWTPDGRGLVVAAAVQVDPDARGARAEPPKQRRGNAPEVVWKLPYKSDGMGYLLAREVHLFHVDARSAETRQLTDGAFDVMAHAVSPNGRHIAYVRSREGRFAHRTDLWVCDLDGGHARRLTRDLAMVLQPVWSADGRWIAFAGSRAEGDAQELLWLLDFTSGELRQLGGDSMNVADPKSLRWSDDAIAITFCEAWRGRHRVSRIGLGDARPTPLVSGDRQLGAFAQAGSHFALVVDHPAEPSEVTLCGLDGKGERRATDFNPWWRERTPVRLESREFRVPDGQGGTETVEGWLLRSEGAKTPAPLLSDVHGGPASYALLDFDTNVYWQVLCSQGWAVLALNAVGSASYGREFCDRLMGRWGDLDLPQHLAAVKQLQAEGVCDDRVTIAGKSYGGYLSAWAIGQSQLFRAAVVMAPVGNVETHYGTSDGGYYADPLYMGGGPRFDRELARKLSPMKHIEKARTPTLFLQGKEDERCPKCQSEELFVSMMRAGETPAEMVLYPDEGHLFLGEGAPSVREDACRRIVDWLASHLGRR